MDGIGWASPPGERNQIGGKTGDGTKLAEPEGRSDGLRRRRAVTACGS